MNLRSPTLTSRYDKTLAKWESDWIFQIFERAGASYICTMHSAVISACDVKVIVEVVFLPHFSLIDLTFNT